MRIELITITNLDPAANLALEEQLTREHDGECIQVLLYRNAQCVVVGRNQNPWTETDPNYLRAHGIQLLRRISGGGAVYHDPGNLNYSFILPRTYYAPNEHVATVCSALGALGVKATSSERNDIMAEGKKISGTAYMLSAQVALHHGTLLVNADLESLRAALKPSLAAHQVETKAIPSVKSSVTNICDICAGFDAERLVAALERELQRAFGCPIQRRSLNPADPAMAAQLGKYRDKHADPEWTYGRTPRFVARLTQENGTELLIDVKAGRIVEVADGTPGATSSHVTGEWFNMP